VTRLEVSDLSVRYPADDGPVRALEGLDLSVRAGETVALLGESGSGKTTLVDAVLGLLDDADVSGSVRLDGRDLTTLDEAGLREVRGTRIGSVPQDGTAALNPAYTVGDQVAEVLRAAGVDREPAASRAPDELQRVGLDPARADDHPHELSGGQATRALLALALAPDPDLLLADEPTRGLDVVTQDRVLDALATAQVERDLGVLLVTHDVGVAARVADRVGVLYGGRLVEVGPAEAVLGSPAHPYTMGLLGAVPALGGEDGRLVEIPGGQPDRVDPDPGCRFRERCPFRTDDCDPAHPPLEPVGEAHEVACVHRADAAEMRESAATEATWR